MKSNDAMKNYNRKMGDGMEMTLDTRVRWRHYVDPWYIVY